MGEGNIFTLCDSPHLDIGGGGGYPIQDLDGGGGYSIPGLDRGDGNGLLCSRRRTFLFRVKMRNLVSNYGKSGPNFRHKCISHCEQKT